MKALLEANFEVTVLTRAKKDTSDDRVGKVVEVDYTSLESLTSALQGQDAVISLVGSSATDSQKILIDAAVAAGVKHFIPSDIGSCSTHPDLQAIPWYSSLAAVRKQLADHAKAGAFAWTVLATGVFVDVLLTVPILFDFDNHTTVLLDGGNNRMSVTSLDSVGKAIAAILKNTDKTSNQVLFVSEAIVTQNSVLDLAKEVRPDVEWTTTTAASSELLQQSLDGFAVGDYSWNTVGKLLSGTALAGDRYGAAFEGKDNELLGVPTLSNEQLKALIAKRLA